MALLTPFSFKHVRAAFQSCLASSEHEIKDQTLPEPCAALGRLLLRMGLDGVDYIGREHVDGLSLKALDQYQAKATKSPRSPKA
jgi:hypothetical protein